VSSAHSYKDDFYSLYLCQKEDYLKKELILTEIHQILKHLIKKFDDFLKNEITDVLSFCFYVLRHPYFLQYRKFLTKMEFPNQNINFIGSLYFPDNFSRQIDIINSEI
jgi:hypothetical protein